MCTACSRSTWLLALMKSADRLPEHSIALFRAIAPWVSPAPGLDRFVIISQHLAPPPAVLMYAERVSRSGGFGPISLTPRQDGPDDPRDLVRQGHCGDLRPLALEQTPEPVVARPGLSQ